MSPRPRTVEDAAILEAAVNVIGRIGPDRLTLADVGVEAGLSAATLVQRFGSKRDLMLSAFRFATAGYEERFETAIKTNDSPLEALFAAAMDRAPTASPEELARMLAFYLSEAGDPEFRAVAAENVRKAVEGFKRMLDEAVAEGEITESYVDTAQLAETIYSLVMGTLLNWTISGDGNYRNRIRRELDVLLRPFRRGPRKAVSETKREAPSPAAA